MRPSISIRGSVRPSVRPSVGRSVGNAFFNRGIQSDLTSINAPAQRSLLLAGLSALLEFFSFSPIFSPLSSFLTKHLGRFSGLSIISKPMRLQNGALKSFPSNTLSNFLTHSRYCLISFGFKFMCRRSFSRRCLVLYILLDASICVYMRVCPSVGPSVRRSVRWSRVFFESRKLIINSIESLEKLRHCSLTSITCKKILKRNFKTKF